MRATALKGDAERRGNHGKVGVLEALAGLDFWFQSGKQGDWAGMLEAKWKAGTAGGC